MVYGNGNSLIWYICIRGSGDEDPDRMDDISCVILLLTMSAFEFIGIYFISYVTSRWFKSEKHRYYRSDWQALY